MKAIITVFITLFWLTSFSQQNHEVKTIFGDNVNKISGYGFTLLNFTNVNGKSANIIGGGGAFILNDNHCIGAYGSTMANGIKSNSDNIELINAKIKIKTSGLFYAYVFSPMKPIHFSLGVMNAYGEVVFVDDVRLVEERIFTISPLAEVEINMTTFFRLALGTNYTQTLGMDDVSNHSNDDFSNFGFFLNLKFGWFK